MAEKEDENKNDGPDGKKDEAQNQESQNQEGTDETNEVSQGLENVIHVS